jgi:NDP-sugar pyrophosphorylase family protein
LRFAAKHREESGPLYAFNGDELHDVDLRAFLEAHEEHGGAATIVVAPLRSQFGVVELADDDRVTGFREAPRLPHWVNAGVYVLDEEALARLPERGDHEQSTFPELSGEGKLFAFRHEGLWITVNTPKDLERAEEHYAAHPELRPTLARGRS